MSRNHALNPLLAGALLSVGFLTSVSAIAQDPLWSEEFDSGSQPNEDVWTYDLGKGPNNDGWGNWELQEYTSNPQNIKIEDGKLVITAIPNIVGEEVVGFTSARIKTQDKLAFKYGRIEARIKVPDLERGFGRHSGCWAAVSQRWAGQHPANWTSSKWACSRLFRRAKAK